MVKNKTNVSATMQEYLAEAYRLAYYQDNNPYVSTSALAEAMGVSAPAVTRMVQRLQDRGYLEHQAYQGLRLTPAGEREALAHLRRHRLVECFLVTIMGFAWHEVHALAGEFEPVVSDAVIQRMAAMIESPLRCPHGEPIPTADGIMPSVVDYPLAEVEAGRDYVVSRVNTYEVEKLHYCAALGLSPGTAFQFVERAPFDGPLQLRVGEQTHFIGQALAIMLRVCSRGEFDLR